jgi:hypothetical protein
MGALPQETTDGPQPVGTVAGRPLEEVMDALRRDRPVFHSEADLQHGFARALWTLAPDVRSRLEVPQRRQGRAEYLDLLCVGPSGRTAIEFKYVTRAWKGVVPDLPGEEYHLRAHAADDLARLHFVRDVARLERFCDRAEQNGLAILVTNVSALWTAPTPRAQPPRDRDFRIHEGRRLSGTLLWGGGEYTPNTCHLRGTYPLTWRTYSEQAGVGGTFRYLAVPVAAAR